MANNKRDWKFQKKTSSMMGKHSKVLESEPKFSHPPSKGDKKFLGDMAGYCDEMYVVSELEVIDMVKNHRVKGIKVLAYINVFRRLFKMYKNNPDGASEKGARATIEYYKIMGLTKAILVHIDNIVRHQFSMLSGISYDEDMYDAEGHFKDELLG